ncbi:MAG: hypothetical protein ACOC33_00420 [bacterium]
MEMNRCPALNRAYEIAKIGNFSICIYADIEKYPQAKEDSNYIFDYFYDVKFSNDAEINVEIYKPDYDQSNKIKFETKDDIHNRVCKKALNELPEFIKNNATESMVKKAYDGFHFSQKDLKDIDLIALFVAKLDNSKVTKIEHFVEAIHYKIPKYDKALKKLYPTKKFGTNKDGIIITIDETKLTIDYINQIRNYLNVKENEIKKKMTYQNYQ